MNKIVLAPYCPLSTLRSSVEYVAKTMVKNGAYPIVDRNFLRPVCANSTPSIISGMKCLDLINGDYQTTIKFRNLICSYNNSPQGADPLKDVVFLEIIQKTYSCVFDNQKCLESMNSEELASIFENELNTTGSTLTKAMALFIELVKINGIKINKEIFPIRKKLANKGRKNVTHNVKFNAYDCTIKIENIPLKLDSNQTERLKSSIAESINSILEEAFLKNKSRVL